VTSRAEQRGHTLAGILARVGEIDTITPRGKKTQMTADFLFFVGWLSVDEANVHENLSFAASQCEKSYSAAST
jgi:hypothetical protein